MKRGISIVLVVIFILVVVSGCGDDGKIRVPKSASECKGKDYLDVKALFESAGFTNVNVRAIEDLVTGWITKDGSVERVSINGDDDFGSSSKFDPVVEVVVMYHTFPPKSDPPPTPIVEKEEETNETANETVQESVDVESTEEEIVEEQETDKTINETTQKSEGDEYSDAKSGDIAYQAVKKYGEMVFKYGIKYNIMSPDTQREYEGNGIWHIRIAAKCTNEYGAVRNSIIDARVDFNKESVIEFNVE